LHDFLPRSAIAFAGSKNDEQKGAGGWKKVNSSKFYPLIPASAGVIGSRKSSIIVPKSSIIKN